MLQFLTSSVTAQLNLEELFSSLLPPSVLFPDPETSVSGKSVAVQPLTKMTDLHPILESPKVSFSENKCLQQLSLL